MLIYNGNKDIVCNTPAALSMFPPTKTWSKRKAFRVNGQDSGFIQTDGNLTFVGLDNAGHLVPKDQPEEALLLLKLFINGTI